MKFEKNPLVSIIMPVFNGSLYLEDVIKSILNQTYRNLELLILDDCSVDQSIKIIEQFDDDRIKLFKNRTNQGYVKGLNFLISKCKGKLVARNDQDDISLPLRIEKQVKTFLSLPSLAVLGGQIKTFGLNSKRISYPTSKEDIKAFMLFNTALHHPTIMFNKSKVQFNDRSLYNEKLAPSEDYFLWTELSEELHVENLPDIILKYRVHTENYSTIKKQDQKNNNLIIREKYFKKYLNIKIDMKINAILNKLLYSDYYNLKEIKKLRLFFHEIIKTKSNHQDYIYLQNVISFFWLKAIIVNGKEIGFIEKLFFLFDCKIKIIRILRSKYLTKKLIFNI